MKLRPRLYYLFQLIVLSGFVTLWGCAGKELAVSNADGGAASSAAVLPAAEDQATALPESLVDPSPNRLVLAARYGQADLVRYLLDGGMDVNAIDTYGNTPLIAAAGSGQRPMVRFLLERNADVNALNNEDNSALMAAAAQGDYKLLHALLEAGADVDARNNKGETALFFAVQYGHLTAARVLLNAGARPNLRNTVRVNSSLSGYTPLIYAADHGLTNEAVDWSAIAKLLLNNGADPNLANTHGEPPIEFAQKHGDQTLMDVLVAGGAKDVQIYTTLNADEALIKAARVNDAFQAMRMLRDGANSNFVDGNGVTPLLAAALEGNSEIVQLLVDARAEINYVPSGLRQFAMSKSHAPLSEHQVMQAASRGDTALIAAGREGHRDVVALLLTLGADVDLANRHGETALFLAVTQGDTPLTTLLLNNGADPNTLERENRSNRMTAARIALGRDSILIKAVQEGHEEIAHALLNAGATADHRGHMGKSALYWAIEKSRPAIAGMLLSAGVTPDINSLAGMTPLMEAARLGDIDSAQLLLDHGANVNAFQHPDLGYDSQSYDVSGMTALMFAARNGHTDLVKLLLEANAQVNIHNGRNMSAIQEAAANDHIEVVKLLQAAGSRDQVNLSQSASEGI